MASQKTVVIGCKLPHGIILDHPLDRSWRVTIAGLNRALIIGATFAATVVDAEFWEIWKTANGDFAPLKSGAIFDAKSQDEAAGKAADLADEVTGFEGMEQNAMGIKPVTEE